MDLFAIPSLPQLFLIVLIFFWMYILYEIIKSDFPGREGTLWVLLVFFVPLIGLLAYLAFGRRSRLKKV